MIKFFRKLRWSTLSRKRIPKYILYAIGEIILVVIGILIALQINNWNENRKAQIVLKDTYEQIRKDLKVDTLNISRIISQYEELDINIQDVLDDKYTATFYDTITPQNYKNCTVCTSYATMYLVFVPQNRGYQSLKNLNGISANKNDTLQDHISAFYVAATNRLETIENIQSLTKENIKLYQQYDWFVDWVEKEYNKDFLIFIFESEAYRKIIVHYRIFAIKNYLERTLKPYQARAVKILEQLDRELGTEASPL